jgi:hypothetical protein
MQTLVFDSTEFVKGKDLDHGYCFAKRLGIACSGAQLVIIALGSINNAES